ncbi:SAM-dependent methyltransferase [Paenibacillus jamilae]|jgi:SAM-dependent methyltransferase|uniref:class I SAM-dependent methyltransferase n=1 Tax=Paenibacillus TaxID=44249 RepID=UPI000D308A66|nr:MULTISPECIES: class I SAM-dependent methyltransferase [Paenibacillus]MDP9676433.1 SAM-dependent methyltransferase [Paenibacillus jamilae]KAF6619321.1 methyltransferase domain-containing protein [Paenibacillus sp. EKM101P]KAF6624413.1 methyltransferase domain-containing protein [Paenibacillus sp. EKM102P]KAF6635810.1 methyltransferase domain-containing protein [Paenibacillus sp. EKM10P]KAF6648483.1 methyltransferase domain-containing protein [Paenibacillus sp. EKM11P]
MGFLSVLSYAHQLVAARVQPGDTAIDATVGTGADTLFLAKAAGKRGRVYGFDIQQAALDYARRRLEEDSSSSLAEVSLLLQGHEQMREAVPDLLHGKVAAVMFNLGYLPSEGADLTVITHTDSTLVALEAALHLLRPRGILTAVLYPGHAGGREEAEAVLQWASALPVSSGQSIIYRQLQLDASPYVVAVEKK